ncbi:MAG: DNA-processing protein DprA [Puniceicoccales bacterium]|jgi:DNA processing protein|nr:DNA-processing protein DprA [Puniceicoccales bacterium]
MDLRTARLILNALPGIGPIAYHRLTTALGNDPTRIFQATRTQLLSIKGIGKNTADTLQNWKQHFDPDREQQKLTTRNLHFHIPEDGPSYPPLLREIDDPPIGLYATANPYTHGTRAIGIVGSRRHTAYGLQMARTLARELAATGWCIISGLARGIDTAAHQGALEANGPTTAILGNGIDIVYPPENLELYRRIATTGTLLSEFPLGRPADKQTFPMRNRIISGIARALIVIESDLNGGSMITARFAADQNRLVCALPGRADQPTSRGCHALIRDGATLVTTADEILQEIGEPRTTPPTTNTPQPTLPLPAPANATEAQILQHLTGGLALSPDTLAEKTQRPIPELIGTLLMMELNHLIQKTPDGRYEIPTT